MTVLMLEGLWLVPRGVCRIVLRMTMPYRAALVPAHRLPARFHALLRLEVRPDERVLWIGFPRQARLRARAAGNALFAIAWTVGIALLILVIAKFGGLLCLFGVPLMLVGLSLIVAHLEAFRDAARTFYVVTDVRAIVFEGDGAVSVPRERMRRLARTERSDGSGDLVLFEDAGTRATSRIGFYGIDRVRHVEALLAPATTEMSRSDF